MALTDVDTQRMNISEVKMEESKDLIQQKSLFIFLPKFFVGPKFLKNKVWKKTSLILYNFGQILM